ncbi:hypothetical protein PT974_04014 [Cladobotryum mycophilum]|uniref:F-box domain-containing protein n=1 Tax=Cladobotryum mycophilum TaxID=491253 RepID=A0ABR0SV34_9HYPO
MTETSSLWKLPNKIQFMILGFLDMKSLIKVARVKPFHAAATTMLHKRGIELAGVIGSKSLVWATLHNMLATMEFSFAVGGLAAINGNSYMYKPLHFAALMGHDNMVSLLLDNGASIELTTRGWYGFTGENTLDWVARETSEITSLGLAIARGHESTAHLLLERGASLHIGFKRRSLSASAKHSIGVLHAAAASDLDVNAQDEHGDSALHMVLEKANGISVGHAKLR